MNFDVVVLDYDNKGFDKVLKKLVEDVIVWFFVLVLENICIEKGLDGLWKGVDVIEFVEVFVGMYVIRVS